MGVAMHSPWTKIVGTGIFLLYCFIWVFVMLMTCAWFILFHLSYYNVAHRISLLTSFIHSDGNMKNSKKLRTCGYIFDQICQVSKEIGATLFFINSSLLSNCFGNSECHQFVLLLSWQLSIAKLFRSHRLLSLFLK